MRRSPLKTLLLAATMGIVFSSSSNADDQVFCDTNPRGRVDFADAAFNTVGPNNVRTLQGNAFAIFAEPMTSPTGEGANRRRDWNAIMVTAAHVIRNACDGFTIVQQRSDGSEVRTPVVGLRAGGEWWLTLAPGTNRLQRYQNEMIGPVEVRLTTAVCDDIPPPGGPDLMLFQQRFNLPGTAVMLPYVVGNPRRSDGNVVQVRVGGFKPRQVTSTRPVYNTNLRWREQEGYTLNTTAEMYPDIEWLYAIEGPGVYTNQSGSPIVDDNNDLGHLVYGVLARQGVRPTSAESMARIGCARNSAQIDESAPVSQPQRDQRGQRPTIPNNACPGDQDIINYEGQVDRTAGVVLLVDYLDNFSEAFAGLVERQASNGVEREASNAVERESVARVDAAMTLYRMYESDPREERVRVALGAALNRLNVIEQARFMSRIRDSSAPFDPNWMCVVPRNQSMRRE